MFLSHRTAFLLGQYCTSNTTYCTRQYLNSTNSTTEAANASISLPNTRIILRLITPRLGDVLSHPTAFSLCQYCTNNITYCTRQYLNSTNSTTAAANASISLPNTRIILRLITHRLGDVSVSPHCIPPRSVCRCIRGWGCDAIESA
jgi:hypothetical protein